MRVLLVGLGGAGTKVADRVADAYAPGSLWERIKRWFFPPPLDLEVLAADAPEAGEGDLVHLSPEDVLRLGEGAGAGGDLEAGTRAWRRDAENVRAAAGETELWDLAIVVGAAGGGTAGATMGPVVDTLQSLGRDAPVLAAPILPFDDEADRIHRTAAPALARIREADPLAAILLSNERLGSPEGRLSTVYGDANEAIVARVRFLLDLLSGPGLRATDLGALETTLEPGNGFAVLGYAQADHPQDEPGDVVAEALSGEAASAEADPADEAARVLLLVRGDPDELAMEALLDRARETVPEREVLLGVRADAEETLEVLAVVSLERSRAVASVLDRHEEIVAAAQGPDEDALGDRLEGIEEPEEGPEPTPEKDRDEEGPDGTREEDRTPEAGEEEAGGEEREAPEEGEAEPPEWVEDYRAAQQRAKELDIKANQSHDELVEQIREAQEDESS